MESKYKKSSLAVLIPMYNEEKVAARCIDEVIAILKTLPIAAKLIIVNDGSSDKTAEIINKKKKEYKKYIVVIHHKTNKGYGAASQTGNDFARKNDFTWILHMDSDLTNDPRYIFRFMQYIDSLYDCVKASRYVKGGRTINVPFYRRVISLVGNKVASICLHVGINDCTNGFRMVRTRTLGNVHFTQNNFGIIMEEMYLLKKRGAKFAEFPYTLTARKSSVSHFSYKPNIFWDYLKYVIKT